MRVNTYLRQPLSRRVLVAVATVAVIATGCSRGGDDDAADTTSTDTASTSSAVSTSTPSSTTPETTEPSSTSATPDSTTANTAPGATTTRPAGTAAGGATTTVAPAAGATTTTVAPGGAAATTTTPAPAQLTAQALVLRSDGIGPFGFGVPADGLVVRLAPVLGEPVFDETLEYPLPTDGGFAVDEFGDEVFAHRWSRNTCFENGLCIQFGGDAETNLTFVGWIYGGIGEPVLTTASGATTESRWADFPAMTVYEGGCFTDGSGTIDGIDLSLASDGALFADFDDDGNMIPGNPAPADVFVVELHAGTLPIYPFLDC